MIGDAKSDTKSDTGSMPCAWAACEVAMREVVSFGTWLKRRRKALDLTQADLARLVGCAYSAPQWNGHVPVHRHRGQPPAVGTRAGPDALGARAPRCALAHDHRQ